MYDDNGTIWLGGDDGRVATLENNRITEYNFLDRPRLNGRGRIRSIEYVDKDRFALNFEYRLIFVKDRKLDDIFKFGTKSFIRYRDKFLYGSSTHFSVVPITRSGIMLAGNGKKSLGHLNQDPTGLEDYLFDHNRTTDMVGDSLGRVWMATNKGLIYYNFPGNKLDTRYLNWFLLKKPIQCVEMVNDHLLCGIQGFGLGILFKDKLSLLPSSSFDGALIRKIVSRDQNSFWVCTNKGLFFLRAIEGFSKFTIQRFAAGNGLLSNEVNDIISRDDLWYVACDKGLSLFPANLESSSRDKPPGLTSNYVLINSRKISENQNPTYTEGNVEIDFAYTCLDFTHFRNLIFRYRLNEKDEWKIKRNASQRLSNLSEGEYRIEIQAKSPGSSWGPSLYMPEFTVVPPFWQRTWFLFLVVIGSVGASSLIVYNFIWNKQERANLDNQLTEANLKALRAQIKPHFIFNALNSVQHFFLENQKEEGLEFLGRFSQLIRKMLKGSDNQFHSLEEEIELIGEYLEIEKDRIGDFFRFGIDAGPGIDLKTVQIPTMLLQPMVENALWHGIMFRAEPGGIIELKIRKEATTKMVKEGPGSERLIITVTDNGAGRKAAEERRNKVRGSFGLRSIRQKLELLNKKYGSQIHLDFEDIISENNLPGGTRVILNLPLQYIEM